MTQWAGPRVVHLGIVVTMLAAFGLPALAPAAAQADVRPTYLSALTPAQIAALSANQTQRVIVLLKNQFPAIPGAGSQLGQRESAVAADQAPITQELATLHAPHVHGYGFVNAISATISPAEEARLAADPAVQAVVPDVAVPGPTVTQSVAAMTAATGAARIPPVVASPPGAACPANPAQPLLEPEALQVMNVDGGPGSRQPEAHDYANGAGVKIAVFPDGLDPTIPDFMRNGRSVVFDYQDFSGEGVNAVTGGEEAFGDVSSLVAQGNEVYDLSGEVNHTHPLPPGCTIRIEGVAPGASVAVMKVFGTANEAFNSIILQAIDWAITHDHVDILSESFGGNPVPNPGTDAIAVADADAVAAGITVVASSGDAGWTNTIGTPANGAGVIGVGASTTYREYVQTTSYGEQFGSGGWESNNISSASSSGETDAGPATVDVVAPGENGWADCSPNTTVFTECADLFNGPRPQPIVAFGGTSEAAPLTAGVAALVIQAYRQTHGGVTPSPAVVKRIIMSSAQDLGAPGDEQGAGLVDGLRAVQEAMSLPDAHATPTATGTGLLYSPNAITLTGEPGASSTTPVTVTNNGTAPQQVSPSVRVLGPPRMIAQGTIALNQATDPVMAFMTGQIVGDVHELTFTVPPRTDRLVSQIAWQTASQVTSTVRETLFDPNGAIAAQSRPQGSGGGFGQVEVRNAIPGTWMLLVFETEPYTGPLAYTITRQHFHTVSGSVSPGPQELVPGQSATFQVQVTTPEAPGDAAESVVFGPGVAGQPAPATIPVTLRSLVPLGPHGGQFSGTITGGNARMPFYGQDLIYQFDVPPGMSGEELKVDVALGAPGYQVIGILSDANFSPVDAESTLSSVSTDNFQSLSLRWLSPTPGRWTLDLTQINNVASLLTGAPITGSISFGPPSVSASIPTDAQLAPGATETATITVTNDTTEPQAYSVDPRLDAQQVVSLSSLVTPTGVTIPVTDFTTVPQFVVPPFSTQLEVAAESTVPITMDLSPSFGYPDVAAVSEGNAAVATISEPDLPASVWACPAAEQGPFAAAVSSTSYSCGAAALTAGFDPGVTSSTGNIWSALEGLTNRYSPLVLSPGQTGTITVVLRATGSPSQRVAGFLAVETFNPNTFSSDQIAALPYRYSIG